MYHFVQIFRIPRYLNIKLNALIAAVHIVPSLLYIAFFLANFYSGLFKKDFLSLVTFLHSSYIQPKWKGLLPKLFQFTVKTCLM